MKNWIRNNWSLVILVFVVLMFIALVFTISSVLEWRILTTISGVLTFSFLFVVIFAWTFYNIAEEKPYPLIDICILDEAKRRGISPNPYLEYQKETGRSVHSSFAILNSPDEQLYIKWLEEMTSNYLILRDGIPDEDIRFFDGGDPEKDSLT
jgi:energy-coupling factor transporter transmembrane protein EcfT